MLPLVLGTAAGLRALGASTVAASATALAFLLLGLLVMLFVSRRLGLMVHCSFWCPMGLFANLLGKLSIFRLRIGPECTACGACSPTCRSCC